MPKRIMVYQADGFAFELTKLPSLQEMQALVGGYIEQVTVLDRVEAGQPIYTLMYVNEDGLNDHMPRNAKATEIYQRNARWQHPDAENPFIAMDSEMRQRASAMGATLFNMQPPEYAEDPWIAGPAIVFEGWDCAAVNQAYGG